LTPRTRYSFQSFGRNEYGYPNLPSLAVHPHFTPIAGEDYLPGLFVYGNENRNCRWRGEIWNDEGVVPYKSPRTEYPTPWGLWLGGNDLLVDLARSARRYVAPDTWHARTLGPRPQGNL